MYFVLKEKREFNEKQYEEKLNRLGRELVLDDAAVSEEAERNVEELLDQIAYNTGCFPEEVLEKVIYRREEAIPLLLDILSKVRNNPEKYRDEKSYFAHIYAAYLLAQFHVNEPCPCGSGKKYKKCCGK